jgi:hypothetical protein
MFSVTAHNVMELKSSLPGLRYPTYRDALLKCTDLWLEGRRQDDNAEGLWRVDDNLYDFSSWMDRHPGGSEWINATKVPGFLCTWWPIEIYILSFRFYNDD